MENDEQQGIVLLSDAKYLPKSGEDKSNEVDYANGFRNEVLKIKTDKAHISIKNDFPYVPSKIVDDIFCRVYPLHEITIVQKDIVMNYYILYTVSITVTLPNGTKITKVGSGGSRIQVKSAAKDACEAGKKNITPFDYIDAGNSDKAALTLAIRNCQERFYIAADVNDRVIMTGEQIAQINGLADAIIKKCIVNPRDQIKMKEKWNNCKTTAQKIVFIENLRENYDCEELFINQQ